MCVFKVATDEGGRATDGAGRRRTALPANTLLSGDVTPGPYGVHPALKVKCNLGWENAKYGVVGVFDSAFMDGYCCAVCMYCYGATKV